MKADQTIYIQLTDEEGRPVTLGDVLVEIVFFTCGKRRYTFKMGRTNEMGAMIISYFDIEKLRAENAKFFLMDYNTKLEECDSTVQISIPSHKDLRDSFERATKAFGKAPEWSTTWPSNARIEPSTRVVELSGTATSVQLSCKRV